MVILEELQTSMVQDREDAGSISLKDLQLELKNQKNQNQLFNFPMMSHKSHRAGVFGSGLEVASLELYGTKTRAW
ncbi:hypothetical protein ATANTOWER_011455 [Ataeniobius toweri]|uniref:Uncharacterized protein n=1 Tax=Ataeniobius toweri TaxID=208326 RepID=A0ABU7B8R0_9TELE|nr:hypothetical protein [Ataeniobius toweri]